MKTFKLTIHVTKEDITKGRRCASNKCPVARAAQRALKRVLGEEAVRIGDYSANVDDNISFESDVSTIFVHMDDADSDKMNDFVNAFDCKKKVKPMILEGTITI